MMNFLMNFLSSLFPNFFKQRLQLSINDYEKIICLLGTKEEDVKYKTYNYWIDFRGDKIKVSDNVKVIIRRGEYECVSYTINEYGIINKINFGRSHANFKEIIEKLQRNERLNASVKIVSHGGMRGISYSIELNNYCAKWDDDKYTYYTTPKLSIKNSNIFESQPNIKHYF